MNAKMATRNPFAASSAHVQSPDLKKHAFIAISLILLTALTGIFFCKFNSLSVGGGIKPVILMTAIAIFTIAALAVLYGFLISKRLNNESTVFFGALVACGLIFCFLFTPGTVPDEGSHYASSYKYANMLMGIDPDKESTNMREGDHELFTGLITEGALSRSSYERTIAAASPIFADNDSRAYYSDSRFIQGSEITTSMSNSPQMRLAPASGLIIGQLLGLNALWTFYLGRIFNLLWFSVLALIAFRTTPIAKPAFAAIALLPMTLHLAASYSYDATAIGLAMMLTALCLKARYGKGKASNSTLVLIVVSAFLLAPCKVVYSTLILLVFAIPKNKFNSKKACHLFRAIVFVGTFAGIALFSIPNLITISGVEERTELERSSSESGQRRTMMSLISNPLESLFIYLNTIYTYGTFYLNSFIGGSLGWFQAELAAPHLFLIAYGVVLIASSQRTTADSAIVTRKVKLLLGITCLIVFVGVLTSLYLDWTYAYEYVIQGVQGRYLLPCGVLLLLLFRVNRYTTAIQLKTSVPLCMYGLNMMYAIFILAAALRVV